MGNIKEPDVVIAEFLNAEVTELVRVGLSLRNTNAVETFDGDGAETEFTVTNTKLLCVNSVSVDAVVHKKYLDYNIDLINNKIIFTSAPASGTDNISIDYDYNISGTTWVHPDKPRKDLSRDSYPRLGVTNLNESHEFAGQNETDMFGSVSIQIDVITYKNLKCTIGGETKEGQDVVDYLARQVISKLKNPTSPIKYKLWNPVIKENRNIPYNEKSKIFHKVVSVGFAGKNIGD